MCAKTDRLIEIAPPYKISGSCRKDRGAHHSMKPVAQQHEFAARRQFEGKTAAARRTLDLMTESRRILAARMVGDSAWVFPSKRNPGKHITRLNSAHDRLCRQARADGIAFNFVLYDFRHTWATRRATAMQGRFDLASLAAMLGHSSLRNVQKYVHPTAEHQRDLVRKYDEILQAAAKSEGETSERKAIN